MRALGPRYRHLGILPLQHFVCGLPHVCPNTCHLIHGYNKQGLDEAPQNGLAVGLSIVELLLCIRTDPQRVGRQALE